MKHVDKASVSDLHVRTSELVKAAAEGTVIIIERLGEPVAELRPITRKLRNGKKPLTEEERRELAEKVFAKIELISKNMPQLDGDSGKWLEENR